MRNKNIIEADYHEIEYLVREHYGNIEYEFADAQECTNDTSHSFSIDGKLDDYDLEKWESAAPHYMYNNRLVLNKLCADGYIEPGDYVIRVSW